MFNYASIWLIASMIGFHKTFYIDIFITS